MSHDPPLVTDLSVREAYSEDASGLIGLPDAVARPANEREVSDVVAWCAGRGTGVTAQGLRSSTVASPLAFGGVALSLEKMDRIISIDPALRRAVVEPGLNLGLFKKEVKRAGLFFPPDPTSENECTVGGAVMTNASGARSYKYGATRPWVHAMRLVLGDGTVSELRRSRTTKNTVGYFGFQNPIDLMVGSEGTLGILTRVELELLAAPPGFVAGMAFFRDLATALSFVKAADLSRREHRVVRPRCLELFDDGSLDLIRPAAAALAIPGDARAAIYFEQETDRASDSTLEAWLQLIEAEKGISDDTIVAASESQEEELRRLRHALPATMNEQGRMARNNGGLKIGTDWAVPLEKVDVMIEEATRIAREEFGGFLIRYGHIGNGHPHFNMLAPDPESLERARRAAHLMCLKAVELGGTVTAEHGVGKIKREYVRHQYPSWVIDAMRAVKRTVDPKGILAPGNIFPEAAGTTGPA
jgi:FAD/FMN-containing dehydrogenase